MSFFFQNNILLCGHRSGYLHLHSLSFDNCEVCSEEGKSESLDNLPFQCFDIKHLFEIIVFAIFPRKYLTIVYRVFVINYSATSMAR